MADGRKCLAPGEEGPRHGTGRFQELIVGLEGELDVDAEGEVLRRVGAGQGTWIAPHTLHAVANRSAARACYLFVTAPPSGT
jgi:quercetin dioxygenase-like cupin family protein